MATRRRPPGPAVPGARSPDSDERVGRCLAGSPSGDPEAGVAASGAGGGVDACLDGAWVRLAIATRSEAAGGGGGARRTGGGAGGGSGALAGLAAPVPLLGSGRP